MLDLKKVAITGGLASGKSSVCHFLQEMGAYVVNSDEIVHHLLSPNTAIGQRVIQLLGPDIVKGQSIDRQKVAEKVFADSKLLKALEGILHPAVAQELEHHYQKARGQKHARMFVAEVPLLFEAGEMRSLFHTTVAVVSEDGKRHQRYNNSTGRTDFKLRDARQWNQEDKARMANIVITNDGTLEDLKSKVRIIFENLTYPSN